jgi:hypothetical protein
MLALLSAIALLTQQGTGGKSLAAVDRVLVAEGFHVASSSLKMHGTAVPTLRQGTLTLVYETTVQPQACPAGAPCRHVEPHKVIVEISCDQHVMTGHQVVDSCDGLRGFGVVPQQ